ncbi:MAG: ATP-dependent DNA helicase RecG [Hydrogenophilales bacterium]|nr:ATP-dependent DNA helicase RecG [Hydrogenophilales bacterium]
MVDAVPKGARDKLAKLGIHRDFDFVLHLPLRYVDETHIYPIAHAPFGQLVQVEAVIVNSEVRFRPRRQLVCLVEDGSGEMYVRLLNFYPSQQKMLAVGSRVRLLGELRVGFLGPEMVHPQIRVVREGVPLKENLTPVYPTTAGLGQEPLRKLIGRALASCDLHDTLPAPVLKQHHLAGFEGSVRYLHEPPPDAPINELESRAHWAWQRLIFDELLAQQLSMRRHYARRHDLIAPALPAKQKLTKALLRALPFALTGAQRRTFDEISRDLSARHPMQRLLQGDVGSGKTIVAALACLQAIENGYQAAVMAPTEILAEQHYRKLHEWLSPLGVTVAWIAASVPKRARDSMLAQVASGEAQLAVGTHALFQEQVNFSRLGLAVVDEQHRFGVEQRLALHNKGVNPHQLMMSATPIPRTLSMSYYADLDVSVIDELPPGRTPIVTKLVEDARRDEVIERVRAACATGRQAYWVCPLIEESEKLQLQTALDTYQVLSSTFPDLKVGLVHGRMKSKEKAETMAAFKAGEIQLLVATTVIEVGVDVPNASLMVIEHAERMGLAQLHQLRGRVGRGAAKSACILLYSPPLSDMAKARLKIIYEQTDGFEIARQDLSLRGPGEFLGARQSGTPMLKIADIERDQAMLEQARALAEALLREAPDAAELHLARWLARAEQYLKV